MTSPHFHLSIGSLLGSPRTVPNHPREERQSKNPLAIPGQRQPTGHLARQAQCLPDRFRILARPNPAQMAPVAQRDEVQQPAGGRVLVVDMGRGQRDLPARDRMRLAVLRPALLALVSRSVAARIAAAASSPSDSRSTRRISCIRSPELRRGRTRQRTGQPSDILEARFVAERLPFPSKMGGQVARAPSARVDHPRRGATHGGVPRCTRTKAGCQRDARAHRARS